MVFELMSKAENVIKPMVFQRFVIYVKNTKLRQNGRKTLAQRWKTCTLTSV